MRGFHDPREMNKVLFRNTCSQYEQNMGWYERSVAGFRLDNDLRKASASGGLATWCLEMLLRKKAVTRIAVVGNASKHDKGYFEFKTAASIDELRESCGSVYHPVEISEIIRTISRRKEDVWAVVGVPCLCAAIRNNPGIKNSVPFVLGLACGMYQNTFYTDILLARSGVNRKSVCKIEYRRKSGCRPPGDFRFRGTDSRGQGREIAYRGLPYYLGKNALFRLNACNYCMDVFAETADACFMDAWLPAYSNDSDGTSLAVIRNKLVSDWFQEGKNNGEIWIDEAPYEDVIASQQEHVRRKRELIYMRCKAAKPDTVRINPTLGEKMDWQLQRRFQRRSKKAWAAYGQPHGLAAFWLALSDLLLWEKALRIAMYLISRSKTAVEQGVRMLHGHA